MALNTGFPRMRFDDIFADVERQALSVFGDDLNTDEKGDMGKLLRLIAWSRAKSEERLEDTYNSQFIRTATGASLYKLAANDALVVYEAAYSTGSVTISGTAGYLVPEGTLVRTPAGTTFATDTAVQIGLGGTTTVSITATDKGSAGDVPAGSITILVNPVAEITGVTNTAETVGGLDRESDLLFRDRVELAKQDPGTSGNKSSYRKWASDVPGVGGSVVIPLWAGEQTVKVVLIDADRLPADAAIVQTVQTYIDPQRDGQGDGMAPVGAIVTVVAATAKTINVTASVSLAAGADLATVTASYRAALEIYRRQAAFSSTYFSAALAGQALLATPGVLDYDTTSLKLNGAAGNVPIAQTEVPVLGSITLTEV